jgi:transposase-like protein
MPRRGPHQQKIIPALERADAAVKGSGNDREHGLRIEESYVRVKGQGRYLYRAVDATGATIDVFLSATRDAAAAQRFLTQALSETHPLHPASRQHRQARRLAAGLRKARSSKRTGGGSSAPDAAAPQEPAGP